jgi:hypothetical protein
VLQNLRAQYALSIVQNVSLIPKQEGIEPMEGKSGPIPRLILPKQYLPRDQFEIGRYRDWGLMSYFAEGVAHMDFLPITTANIFVRLLFSRSTEGPFYQGNYVGRP